MLCMRCKKHATIDKTVFAGTTPVKVRLCDGCAGEVDADSHFARIKSAENHEAKMKAVDDFMTALGR